MSHLTSIVVPCYNEEEMIPVFFDITEKITIPGKREYIFVNDGSTDRSLEEIKKLHKMAPDRVRYISFSRNFGKEAGMYAGLQESRGDFVVIMDVDLQDPPELLPEMYDTLVEEKDIDSVATRRVTRSGEPPIRSWFAKMFYKVINAISDTEIVDGARDYRMMNRKMVDSILEVTEYNRFYKGIVNWVGFNTQYLEYENVERHLGETTWSFWQLFKYSIDGIISYSTFPLTIVSLIGFFIFLVSIILAAVFAVRTLIFDNPVQGWTSLAVIMLGLGGLTILSLGIIGQYLGKTFLETKNRPIYIVKETEEDNADPMSD